MMFKYNQEQGRGLKNHNPFGFQSDTQYGDTFKRPNTSQVEIRQVDPREGDTLGRSYSDMIFTQTTSSRDFFRPPPGDRAFTATPAARAKSTLGISQMPATDFWQSRYKAEFRSRRPDHRSRMMARRRPAVPESMK